MSIVVTTPTGHIGSRVVQLLIQAGVRPTLLVRDPARLDAAVRAASEVRQGDLTDADFVLRATEDAEALFWLIPTDHRSDDPVGDIVQVGRHAAEAVAKNGIGRTVLLSSGGAEQRSNDLIGALGQVEDLLYATGANILALRPGFFYTNLLMSVEELKQGVLTTTLPLDMPAPWNDPRDVGDIAAARLLSREWSGQSAQPVTGPEELTFARVAEIVGAAVGRKIEAVRISDEESRQGMLAVGMSAAVAEAYVDMSRAIGEGMASDYARDFISITPTPLGAWCYANLKPALS